MKNFIIIAVISILSTTAKAAVAVTGNPLCNIYATAQNVVVSNPQNQPLEITITKRSGTIVSKMKVTGREKQIPIKDLNVGKYNVVVKNPGQQQQTFRLDVL
ncbi:MAG: hypothetical protein JST70_04980 [Bacteroidetes bacterium]|nr:hypothetical protein [Bacteroidota bacterium]